MDDLLVEFLNETNESLEELDNDLVRLEQHPNDKDLLSKIFRLMHTIKGTCGFLGLPRLETVAHRAENVLGSFRDGILEVTPDYVTLIFASIDRVRMILQKLAETGQEPDGDDSDLIAQLDAVTALKDAAKSAARAAPAPLDITANLPATEGGLSPDVLAELEAAFAAAPGPVETTAVAPLDITANLPANEGGLSADVLAELEAAFAAAPGPVETPQAVPAVKADNKPTVAVAAPAASAGPVGEAQTLRVNVDVLENLMTMVSELVLVRNQLVQISRTQKDSEFMTPLQRLNHIVSDLQEGVMKTRMQPIGNAWSKLPRIIRDISMELGKKIDLVMLGQDTELDRQVLELIKDPLTHMVRNSADHGIEPPDVRLANGKPETGTIKLNAFHEGGYIIIEISDDGKGLALDKIRAKVLQNGLATEDELATMSPNQIYQFIFRAGFSTAEKVTSVSGRGVGMDVVRTNIEKIGGSIDMRCVEGQGMSFFIKIPLTLAIVPALIIAASGQRFAFPQLAVRELVMISTASERQIEIINDAPVYRLREKLLPLITLREIMGLPPHETKPDVQYLVVSQVGQLTFGIIVDQVFDTEEIVVKPVAKILKSIELFSGNTILGDGSVIMILDPGGLARQVGDIDRAQEATSEVEDHANEEKTTFLVFTAGPGAPKAVPLALVARLERFDASHIEQSHDSYVVHYRGKLMPLIPIDEGFHLESGMRVPVLVFQNRDQQMGLMVDAISDIIEDVAHIDVSSSVNGVMGSAIMHGRTMNIIDLAYYLERSRFRWLDDNDGDIDADYTVSTARRRKGRILLVDDSTFFRNMIQPFLKMAGYDVIAVGSPQDVLHMQDRGEEFDLIVSDIEMPDMSGYDLARAIRSSHHWRDVPLLALTSHARPEDVQRGIEAGFQEYVGKFDRDSLLSRIAATLAQYGAREI
jgi:two-component system chemotaxis sensor kinase CheA